MSRKPVVVALVFAAVLASLIFVLAPPFWETNDDVAMGMITGGRGWVHTRSAAVYFSNFLYGWTVSAIPDLFDRSSYDLVSYGLNLMAVAAIAYSLLVILHNKTLALAVAGLIALRMLVFPQFTLLAGGLAVAGFLMLHAYETRRQRATLAVAATLLVLSFLVRREVFLLTLPLAAIALPYRTLFADRAMQIALGAVCAGIVVATICNHIYYSHPDWQAFAAIQRFRVMLTDFGAANQILMRPDILLDTGYSKNDILMLSSWWLVEPELVDPTRLERLLTSFDLQNRISSNVWSAISEVESLLGPGLKFLFWPALAMTLMTRKPLQMALAWGSILGAILFVSLTGRLGVSRVYYPLLAFVLCLAAIWLRAGRLRMLAATILIATAAWASYDIHLRHRDWVSASEQVPEDMQQIDLGRVHVIWGSAFPFQYAFPLFMPVSQISQFRWFGLGSLTIAPLPFVNWGDGRSGLVDRLLHGEPVSFFAHDGLIEYLRIWCAERHGRVLRIEHVDRLKTMTRYSLTCRGNA